MTKNEEVWIRKQMQNLVDKWKDKKEPPFMSKEYIERRTDRVKYLAYKNKLSYIRTKYGVNKAHESLVEVAKKVFNIK
jgi:hypothetical protein